MRSSVWESIWLKWNKWSYQLKRIQGWARDQDKQKKCVYRQIIKRMIQQESIYKVVKEIGKKDTKVYGWFR